MLCQCAKLNINIASAAGSIAIGLCCIYAFKMIRTREGVYKTGVLYPENAFNCGSNDLCCRKVKLRDIFRETAVSYMY